MGKGAMFALGAAAAGIGVYFYMRKTQVANAYALGQANPTTPFTSLSTQQLAQITSSPPLPSPPPASTTIANIANAQGWGR